MAVLHEASRFKGGAERRNHGPPMTAEAPEFPESKIGKRLGAGRHGKNAARSAALMAPDGADSVESAVGGFWHRDCGYKYVRHLFIGIFVFLWLAYISLDAYMFVNRNSSVSLVGRIGTRLGKTGTWIA